jgi:hypothetical protein
MTDAPQTPPHPSFVRKAYMSVILRLRCISSLQSHLNEMLPAPKHRSDMIALRWCYASTQEKPKCPDEIGRLYGYGYQVIIAIDPELCRTNQAGIIFRFDVGAIGRPPRFAAPLIIKTDDILPAPRELSVLGGGESGRHAIAQWHPLAPEAAITEFLVGHVTEAAIRPTSPLDYALAVLRENEARQNL